MGRAGNPTTAQRRQASSARAIVRIVTLAVAIALGLLVSTSPVSVAKKSAPRKGAVTKKCKQGQAQLRVGKRVLCSKQKPLPVTQLNPQAAAIANAFAFQLGAKRKDRHHRHLRSLTKVLRRLGPHTLQNAEKTIALDLRRGEVLALGSAGAFGAKAAAAASAHAASRPVAFAAAGCKSGNQLEKMLKEYEDAPPDVKEKAKEDFEKVQSDKGYKDGDMTSKVDFEKGAIKLGIDVKAKGLRLSMTIRACGIEGGNEFNLNACPTAEGKVEGEDHSEFEVAFKVFEGAKLLLAQGFKISGEATIKAQTGDDGTLDGYDIKHVYDLVASFGGSKTAFGPVSVDLAYIGEAHIDLRAGGSSPPPAVVDVRMSMAGADPAELIAVEIETAHKAQAEADKVFSAEVKKATSNLRSAEKHWMTPTACAKIAFEPGSDTLTLHKGQNGTFKSRTEASSGGAPATAKWTVSGQQNATFTPSGSAGNPLSTSYNVTNAGPKIYVEVTVKATSKAGVAEEKWIQKTNEPLETLTGTFHGHVDHEGEIFDWTGTAALKKRDLGVSSEASRAFGLVSGEATITASGTAIGTGCEQTGTQTLAIQRTATWAVEGEEAPFKYQIVFPFEFPGGITVNLIHCAHPAEEISTFKSIGPAALQSGEITLGSKPSETDFGPYTKTTSDLYAYENKAIAFQGIGEAVEWSWSFKGSP